MMHSVKIIHHPSTPKRVSPLYSSQFFPHSMHHLFTSSYTQTLSGPISNLAVGVHWGNWNRHAMTRVVEETSLAIFSPRGSICTVRDYITNIRPFQVVLLFLVLKFLCYYTFPCYYIIICTCRGKYIVSTNLCMYLPLQTHKSLWKHQHIKTFYLEAWKQHFICPFYIWGISKQVEYRIAGNFREHKFSRITNKHAPGKKFRDFYFRDKVTISDHTPYNFPHVNGDLQRVFQRQNDSKTLAYKRVSRCRQRTAMSKGGSWLRGSIRSCGEVAKNFRSLLDA